MWEMMRGMSDDQLALVGCALALVASSGVLYLSYALGPVGRRERAQQFTAKLDAHRRAVEALANQRPAPRREAA